LEDYINNKKIVDQWEEPFFHSPLLPKRLPNTSTEKYEWFHAKCKVLFKSYRLA